jgi:asparagine synthase (glutamine-hydrolysing)
MPGITGIIRKVPYEGIERDLDLMVETMRHESFYAGNRYINKELGLYAGWMCHQGAFSDCMPLVNRNKDSLLIFHGENYLDDKSAARLRRPGQEFGESKAEYLTNAYDELGDNFFGWLNGWFSGLLVDLRTKRITLFNDRYGMGRIYFHQGKDEFIFSSEAKSLLKIRPALRVIHGEAMAEYLRFNCVTRNKTLFKGIELLPYASAWQFENGNLTKRGRYFQFSEWEQKRILDDDDLYERFAETVSKVFPAYSRSPQNVALSLTAGLDTRAVMASLRARRGSLPCYTFGGRWGELFDVRTARKISKVVGQPFTRIKVNGQFFERFPEFARRGVYISDGTHDAFGAHDVYLNQVAREIAPIRLTGKFGSEVVRVRKLIAPTDYQRDFLQPELRSLVDSVAASSQINSATHPLTRVVSEEIPWHEFGRIAVEQSQITLRTPYMDNELVKLMFQAPSGARAAGALQEQYVRDQSPELSIFPTNLGGFASNIPVVGKLCYLVLWALFKVEYIYLYATPHWITRIDRSLAKLRLERLFAGRQKWEAYRIWIKTDFAEFIRETLFDPGAHYTSFFEKKIVERMVERHLAGTHNYLSEINKVLTTELVFSTLIRR